MISEQISEWGERIIEISVSRVVFLEKKYPPYSKSANDLI